MTKPVVGGAILFLLGVGCGVFLLPQEGLRAGPEPRASSQEAAAGDEAVAIVNGQALSRAMLDIRLDQRLNEWGQDARGDDEASITIRQEIIDDLVLMELLTQQAMAQGMDQHPEVIAGAELAYKTLLAQRLVREMAEQTEITDDEVRDRYRQLPEEPAYKISHILLADEAAALEVIAALDGGGDFARLADERSSDASAGEGGNMGWLTSNRLMYPIADAVAMMEPGQYSRTPIETAAGWHVIRLEGTRTMPGLSLEEAEPWLRDEILNEKVKMQFAELRKKAEIELRPLG